MNEHKRGKNKGQKLPPSFAEDSITMKKVPVPQLTLYVPPYLPTPA